MLKVSKEGSTAKTFTVGFIISIICSVIFMLICALFMTVGGLYKSVAFPLSSVSLGGGCFIGSRYISKKIGSKGYLCGAVNGAIMYFIFLFAGLIINGFSITVLSLLRFVIVMLMSIIGGILGINTSSQKNLVK